MADNGLEKNLKTISGFVAKEFIASMDFSWAPNKQTRLSGCDGVQSAPLLCGAKRRERPKRDPFGAFYCAPGKRAMQVHYLCYDLE